MGGTWYSHRLASMSPANLYLEFKPLGACQYSRIGQVEERERMSLFWIQVYQQICEELAWWMVHLTLSPARKSYLEVRIPRVQLGSSFTNSLLARCYHECGDLRSQKAAAAYSKPWGAAPCGGTLPQTSTEYVLRTSWILKSSRHIHADSASPRHQRNHSFFSWRSYSYSDTITAGEADTSASKLFEPNYMAPGPRKHCMIALLRWRDTLVIGSIRLYVACLLK